MTTDTERLEAANTLILEAMHKLQQATLIINHTKLSVRLAVSTDVENVDNDECLD